MKDLSKIIKLVILIVALVLLVTISYFSFLGGKEAEKREQPPENQEATDNTLDLNIGFSDPENIGVIVGSRPIVKTESNDIAGNDTSQLEDPIQGITEPDVLSPTDALYKEIELTRLRQMLEADLADEISARELQKQAIRSVIGASQVDLSQDGRIANASYEPSFQENVAVNGISPSLVLASNVLGQDQSFEDDHSRPSVNKSPKDLLGYSPHKRIGARSDYEIKKGTLIPGTLITEINSDIPGNVVGMVRHDVFDTITGQHLLIPNGSRLFGIYDPEVAYSQRRINVLWSHIIFPDGDTLILEDQQATDAAGRTGFSDKRKGNFLNNLAGNLLYTVFNAGEKAIQSRIQTAITGGDTSEDSAVGNAISGLGAQIGGGSTSAAGVFNDKQSKLSPTLKIRSGYRFNILVSKDIILEPY